MNHCKGVGLALVIAAVAVLLSGSTNPVAAQAMGTIQGTVTDSWTGNPVQGVQVTVEGTQRRTVTNGSGQYNLSIEPGTYTLMAVTLGYHKRTQQTSVTADDTAIANFALTNVGTSPDAPATTQDLAALANEIKQQRRLIEAQQRAIDELLRRVALLEGKK